MEFFQHPLTTVDWFALALLAVGFIWGLMKGFVRELMSVVAWFLAFMLAPLWGATAGSLIPVQDMSNTTRLWVGYLMVFMCVLILSTVCGTWLRQQLSKIGLGALDRLVGSIFGMLGASAILMLVVVCIHLSPFKRNPEWTRSYVAPVLTKALNQALDQMAPFLSSDFGRFIN